MSDYPIKNLVQKDDGVWILTYLNEELIPFRDAIVPQEGESFTEAQAWAIADERYANYLDHLNNPPEAPEQTPQERLAGIDDDIKAQKDAILDLMALKAKAELDAEFGG